MSEAMSASDHALGATAIAAGLMDRLAAIAAAEDDRATRASKAADWIRSERNFHWVGLYDVTRDEIRILGSTSADAAAFPNFPRSHGLNGAAVSSGSPIICNDVRNDTRYLATFGATRAEAVVPVRSGGSIVGTIDVESERVNAFTADDEDFLVKCAVALERLWR